jgi:alanine-glyoxylate transaminase/serine-glyoxylate transaminase/serine-pyruvate transaminase
MKVFDETIDLLRRLFETEGEVIMMPGPGTAALDSALSSMVPRGQGVLSLDNGFFGFRMGQIIEKNALVPYVIKGEWGEPITADIVREELAEFLPVADANDSPIRVLSVVHHETSTGVLNPLEEIAAVAAEYDLPVIVDAVASFGGVRIPVDDWGIDTCVGVPNKCLAVPPGTALVSVSERAWQMAEDNPDEHGWYLDLRTWRWYIDNWGDWHPYPTTMPTNNIVALNQGLKKVFDVEPEVYFARFQQAAERLREGMAEFGFTLYPDPAYASPTVSALTVPDGVDATEMLAFIRDKYGLMASGGLADLKGKIIRVGHMGLAKDIAVVDQFIEATRQYLTEMAPA